MNLSSTRSKSSQAQLLALLVFILILASGWLLVKPEFAKRKEAKAALGLKTVELAEKQGLLTSVNKLISSHVASADDIAILKVALPESPSIPDLLSSIESIALSVGMQINEFAITEEVEDVSRPTVNEFGVPIVPVEDSSIVKKPELVNLKIEIVTSGAPESFLSLLSELERNLRLLDVQLINVESDDDGVPKEYEIVMQAYYQKQ